MDIEHAILHGKISNIKYLVQFFFQNKYDNTGLLIHWELFKL